MWYGVSKSTKQLIRFVPAGVRVSASKPSRKLGALSLANDWVCDFDLKEFRQPGSRYVFPHDVCATTLKIDGYVLSRKAKVCFGIELTCPMEENIDKWHAAKLAKY